MTAHKIQQAAERLNQAEREIAQIEHLMIEARQRHREAQAELAALLDRMSVPELLPSNWYRAEIVSSYMRPTADGTASYLECRFLVLEGIHAGIEFLDRIHLWDPSVKVQETASKKLSSIANAVGVMYVNDSTQFHGRPLWAQVKRTLDGNEVTQYLSEKRFAAEPNHRSSQRGR